METLQGQLLVSAPSLHDPNFRKTVVLVAHHDEDGAMGLVLSRPSGVAAVEAVPSLDGLPGAAGPVFVGGPVQPEAFMVLAEFDDVEEAAAPIFDRVGFMPADAEPDELAISRMRLFAGYAGWGAGQLEAELEEPAWIVVAGRARRRLRRRPGRALADGPPAQGRPVRADGQHAVRPRLELDLSAGDRRQPDRLAVAARPRHVREAERRRLAAGLDEPASPVPPLVAARHIASATSSGRSSGNPAAAKRLALAVSIIGVSAIPGHTALIRIGSRCGAMLRTKPTTACLVSE